MLTAIFFGYIYFIIHYSMKFFFILDYITTNFISKWRCVVIALITGLWFRFQDLMCSWAKPFILHYSSSLNCKWVTLQQIGVLFRGNIIILVTYMLWNYITAFMCPNSWLEKLLTVTFSDQCAHILYVSNVFLSKSHPQ